MVVRTTLFARRLLTFDLVCRELSDGAVSTCNGSRWGVVGY